MSPDLSPQQEKCNELMHLFKQCQKDHPFLKFVDYCNSEFVNMSRCLKELYDEQTRINREKGKEFQANRRKGTAVWTDPTET